MSTSLTELLHSWGDGRQDAFAELAPRVYGELKRLARAQLRGERSDHTLQPTALVNEACLRLLGLPQVECASRHHFFALAATLMRRILVSHARRHGAAKRGGGSLKTELAEIAGATGQAVDVLALHNALERLGRRNHRQAQVVELRYFGGLGIAETAEVLQVSPATVKIDWNLARAFLLRELGG